MKYYEEINGEKFVVGDKVEIYIEQDPKPYYGILINADEYGNLKFMNNSCSIPFNEIKSIKLEERSPYYNIFLNCENTSDEVSILENQIMDSYEFNNDGKLKLIRMIEKARRMSGYANITSKTEELKLS